MKSPKFYRRRTKIVCTIGPATGSAVMIERLIRAGMNVARLNLSHSEHREHSRYIETIKKLSQRLGTNVAVLMDLPGPKYRIGKLKGGQAVLKKRARVTLTTSEIEGDATLVPVNLPHLSQDVKVGDIMLLDDGAIQLKVLGKEGSEITCRVMVGGILTSGRGLVVPGMRAYGPFITDYLKEHILFAMREKPDYLAISFVSNAGDVSSVRAILRENDVDIPIIAKIAHWSGIPADSVWRDMWRYHQIIYVRQVEDSRPYHYRIAAKGQRFVNLMKKLRLIDTNRLDNELREHRMFLQQKDMEEFRARLSAWKKERREIAGMLDDI